MFFRAIFNCRSPQTGIIKLEWWVEAIFWKNPEERGDFTLIKPLENHVAKNGGTIVKLFLCRSVDEISHLLRHIRRVVTSKKCSENRNLSVGVGGSTLLKTVWIEDGQNSMPPKWLNYPEFLSGPNTAITDARNLLHLNGCRSSNCRWKKVRFKSKQTICTKFYCDCSLLFSKHFFHAKNKDKITCFCLFSWMFRTGIFSFAIENIKKFLQNRVSLLLYG